MIAIFLHLHVRPSSPRTPSPPPLLWAQVDYCLHCFQKWINIFSPISKINWERKISVGSTSWHHVQSVGCIARFRAEANESTSSWDCGHRTRELWKVWMHALLSVTQCFLLCEGYSWDDSIFAPQGCFLSTEQVMMFLKFKIGLIAFEHALRTIEIHATSISLMKPCLRTPRPAQIRMTQVVL